MKKKRVCECGCEDFAGTESNVVAGSFDDDGILYLKGYDALGVEDLKCENCAKELTGDFEIEFG